MRVHLPYIQSQIISLVNIHQSKHTDRQINFFYFVNMQPTLYKFLIFILTLNLSIVWLIIYIRVISHLVFLCSCSPAPNNFCYYFIKIITLILASLHKLGMTLGLTINMMYVIFILWYKTKTNKKTQKSKKKKL